MPAIPTREQAQLRTKKYLYKNPLTRDRSRTRHSCANPKPQPYHSRTKFVSRSYIFCRDFSSGTLLMARYRHEQNTDKNSIRYEQITESVSKRHPYWPTLGDRTQINTAYSYRHCMPRSFIAFKKVMPFTGSKPTTSMPSVTVTRSFLETQRLPPTSNAGEKFSSHGIPFTETLKILP